MTNFETSLGATQLNKNECLLKLDTDLWTDMKNGLHISKLPLMRQVHVNNKTRAGSIKLSFAVTSKYECFGFTIVFNDLLC